MKKRIWLYLPKRKVQFGPQNIPVGPWIFQGHEDKYPDFYKLKFLEPYDHAFSCSTMSMELYKSSRKFVENSTDDFNKIHKLNFSNKFWFRILGGWLNLLFQVAYVRYTYVKNLIEVYSANQILVEVSPAIDWKFDTTHEFATTTSKENFDYWLSSYFLKNLRPDNWDVGREKSI